MQSRMVLFFPFIHYTYQYNINDNFNLFPEEPAGVACVLKYCMCHKLMHIMQEPSQKQ